MRLFLVETSLLRDAADWPVPPAPGDTIVFLYSRQDCCGTAQVELRQQGITVLDARAILGADHEFHLDVVIREFLETWHLKDGKPLGEVDGLLLSHLAQVEYMRMCQPGLLVRFGEVFREILRRVPNAQEVFSDVEDGLTPWGRMAADAMPKRDLLASLLVGRSLSFFAAPNAAPHYYVTDFVGNRFLTIAKRLLGGLRPRFVLDRWTLALRRLLRSRSPRIYVHVNHDIAQVVTKLAADGTLAVYSDQTGLEGAATIRYDHYLTVPGLAWLRAWWQLFRWVRTSHSHPALVVDGYDYSSLIFQSLRHYMGVPLLAQAVQACQSLRMIKAVRPNLVIINGDSTPNVRALIGSDKKFGFKTIYIGHGMRLLPWGYLDYMNYENVVLAVPGVRNMDFYASRIPEERKPERVNVPLPMVADFVKARGKKVESERPRILIIAFGPSYSSTSTRASRLDDYMAEILTACRTFAARGYAITIRSKRYPFNQDYFRYWVREFGLEGKVKVDPSGSLINALLNTDVVICGSTTCYYQSLSMARPAIFFEPRFEKRHYIGVVAREDIDVPIALDAEQIVTMTEDALAGRGLAATFPERFCNELAADYLGPQMEFAIDQLVQMVRDQLPQAYRLRERQAP